MPALSFPEQAILQYSVVLLISDADIVINLGSQQQTLLHHD